MTLYLDPEVKYGGMKVGGIRISAMSHLDKPQSFFLTETRGKKKQHTVEPLRQQQSQNIPTEPSPDEVMNVLQDAEKAAKGGRASFTEWWNSAPVKANGQWARKVVQGLFPGTENKLDALQKFAIQADAMAQEDDTVTEDDPFGTSQEVA
ncbi:hypothetical protein [Arenibacterium sp. LLYu02]|uniref:hypothetical protein n=1 Tax=Arenibacterium sp. LLYu02 TaxID=3404132 RepID=UPI003B218F9E